MDPQIELQPCLLFWINIFLSRLLVILDQKIRISFSFFILFVYEIGSVIGGALSQTWIKIEPYRRHNI